MFRYVKPFLKTGIYIFDKKNIQQIVLSDCKLSKSIKYHLKLSRKNKLIKLNKMTLSSYADYSYGFAKDLFLFKEYAVGYFKDYSLYIKAKTNYIDNIEYLVYPVVNILSFDDANCLVIMERIEGVQYEDRNHDYCVIKRLFEYALESPTKVEKDEYSYLQHGDAKRNNIIWIDENNFVFIDLDNISYRPILFDVLHYCAMVNMSLDEIVLILNDNISLIEMLLSKFGLAFSEESLDYIFYCYARFFIRLGDCYEDIDFLMHKKLDSFPKTEKLLSKLKVSLC